MARGDYSRIRHTFWTDPDIRRGLTFEQKGLLLYYFTSPHSNLIGLYYCPFEYVAVETGLSVDQVREWTLGPLSRYVTYDEATQEVFVHRTGRHQVGDDLKANDKRVKAILNALGEAHSKPLANRFICAYQHWPLGIEPEAVDNTPELSTKADDGSPFEAPSKPLRSHSSSSSSSTAQHSIPPGGRAKTREAMPFEVIPPEPDEVEPVPVVPGDRGAMAVVPRVDVEGVPFAELDWDGRTSGSMVLREWIRIQPTPPSVHDRNRFGRAAKRIADEHAVGEIAMAFVGMRYLWPYAEAPIGKGQPWTPEDLLRDFAKAVPAAAKHPQFKAKRRAEEFNQALDRAASGGGFW